MLIRNHTILSYKLFLSWHSELSKYLNILHNIKKLDHLKLHKYTLIIYFPISWCFILRCSRDNFLFANHSFFWTTPANWKVSCQRPQQIKKFFLHSMLLFSRGGLSRREHLWFDLYCYDFYRTELKSSNRRSLQQSSENKKKVAIFFDLQCYQISYIM